MNLPIVLRDTMLAWSSEAEGTVSAIGEEEFRLFYERTARPLWAYLSRITGDREKADDLLQEAYYRFYRAAAKYENEAHRRNSLFQIATNLARDVNRRERRYEEVPLEREDSSEEVAPIANTANHEHDVAVRTDLARAMKELEPVQRELLWLAYAQGASHEEIAEIVGVKAISVRTLLFRARKKAAAILKRNVEGGAR